MKLVAVIAASLLTVGAFAQSATVESQNASAGLLGKRYVEAGFGWVDFRQSSRDAFGTGVDVNIPVHANFDVNLGYAHTYIQHWLNAGDKIGGTVTGYVARGDSKYFASLGLAYSWSPVRFGSDYTMWNGEVGIEHAVTDKLSTSFSVGYVDDFGQHRDSKWDVSVGTSYAFCPKFVGTASVSYIEYGALGYTAGLAYRF